jgi:ATP-binding cassette, subfamily B, bacterial
MKQSLPRQTISFFWQKAWRYPKYVLALMFTVPITILVHQFLPPLIAANILNRISQGDYQSDKLWESFGNELLLYAALVIFGGAIAWRIVIVLIWKLEGMVVRDLYQHTFKHLMSLDADFHANTFGGSLVSQTNKLAGAYVRFADTTVFQIFTMILAFSYTTIILLPKAPLYVALLWLFSLIFILSAIFLTKHVRRLNAIEAKKSNKQTGYIADMITNIMAVKSFAAEKSELQRFKKITEEVRSATLDIMRAATKRDVYFGAITTSIDVLALAMAAASVVLFNANIATVFLVLSLTANIIHRLWEFSQNTLRSYNRAFGDAHDAIETLNTKPKVFDPTNPQRLRIHKGAISFKNVSFQYDLADSSNALFEDLNLRIKPGEKVGLIGHSGSGKTSLTRLLLRFSDLKGGQIIIDGQDISKITQNDLRKSIAYVPQEPLLFHRSLAENISYGNSEASQQQIEAIAKMSNAHEFISKLPERYETLVGERGVKLSGGQRQRVAIARAMLKNAPILVLDEATSALDSESEQLIQQALWKLMENRTAIVIAHRLSTIQKMDRIIVLDNGKIVEEGSHKELINLKGIYSKLWERQSGGFLED